MSRYQWPVHFALLHNDSLWVFDEVQLMGAGLATSAQLEAFRRGFPSARSCHSLWLSATLRRQWLATVDLQGHMDEFNTVGLSSADKNRAAKRIQASKRLEKSEFALDASANSKSGLDKYLENLCRVVLAKHLASSQTLVIVNQVERAQKLYQLIRKRRPQCNDLLVHARFRLAERRTQSESLKRKPKNRIIVATQAVEAGLDISSHTLVTELAPWASLVQRFGRCNRYGEHAAEDEPQVIWVDVETDAKRTVLPYDEQSLDDARGKLQNLCDAGPQNLPKVEPKGPLSHVLRRKDLVDLFNTDPDLSGFDVDVSDFIRDGSSPSLQVFWRDFEHSPNEPEVQSPAGREELCNVGVGQWRDAKKLGWFWDHLSSKWQQLAGLPRPGMSVLLDAMGGGYDVELGFVASGKESKQSVACVETTGHRQGEDFSDDWRSRNRYPVLLPDHLRNVASSARELCASVDEVTHSEIVERAARWHDVGKVHEVFQETMHCCPEARVGLSEEGPLAKSKCTDPVRHRRRFFRHELVSMLTWLSAHDDPSNPNIHVDLIAYLILAHHGKVRTSLRAMPNETADVGVGLFARGVWEGDVVPAMLFDGERCVETTIDLGLMEIGEGEQGRSWTSRMIELLEQYGPFTLAWLESLVRIADWRASAREQNADERHG